MQKGAVENREIAEFRLAKQEEKEATNEVDLRVARLEQDIERKPETIKWLRKEDETNLQEMRSSREEAIEVEEQKVKVAE